MFLSTFVRESATPAPPLGFSARFCHTLKLLATLALLVALSVPALAQPSSVGSWSAPQPWIYPCIHTSLLPNGKVLYWPGYTGDTPKFWDPITTAVTDAPKAGYNIFCSGHALNSQGHVVAVGGQLILLYGLKDNAAFNYANQTWTRLPQLNFARWYPAVLNLPNGDLLALSGLDDKSVTVPLPEVFETATGAWRPLRNASQLLPLYARSFVAPNGKVFVATLISRYLDTAGEGAWSTVAKRLIAGRDDYGSAAMYEPGKVIFVGGADGPVNTCETINLNEPNPAWRFTGSMVRPRRQHNVTLLPDGKVLATGGSSSYGIDTESGKNLFAEIWDPATGRWTLLAPQQVYRGYHSAALLLPDGRVLSGGGNGHPDSEVFSPPYLFQGTRPVISSAPDVIDYTNTFTVSSPSAASIAKVTLTALGSATHAQNFGQRFISLPFVRNETGLVVTPPAHPNLAPPGFHMLWLVNSAGIPSVSKMVRLAGSTVSPPPPPPPIASSNAIPQDPGALGLVCVKAENRHRSIPRSGMAWQPITRSGSSGTTVLQALPNAGKNIATSITTSSPQLDFDIDFKKTGTHYLWLRGIGATSSDDSCHVGIDGVIPPTASNITRIYPAWTWSGALSGGARATLNVPTAGLHTVSIWMREDGLILDKLVLTTDPAYVPTGLGPNETSASGTTNPPVAHPMVFQQDSSPDGLVSMIAETYHSTIARGDRSWQPVTVAASAGLSAMQALPNTGKNISVNITTTSPQLDFAVNFNRAGVHHVWLRGIAATGYDDTCHAGLDGAVLLTSDKITGFKPVWTWTRNTVDGPVATINVPTTGLHTFTIWMREDGLVLDKIVLTTNPNYIPANLGPPPSARQ